LAAFPDVDAAGGDDSGDVEGGVEEGHAASREPVSMKRI
jgi:hypothetical protein